jgi:hypothetical protein
MMEAEKMSGAPPGSRAFLGCLQDATTKLWNSRSDEEQQLYVRMSEKWSKRSPPPDIQARYERICAYLLHIFISHLRPYRMASSVGAKIIRDFQLQLFSTCGIETIVLTAHKHENEQLITGMCVNVIISPHRNVYDQGCSGTSSINHRSTDQPSKHIAPTGRTPFYSGSGSSMPRNATKTVSNVRTTFSSYYIVL